MPIEIDESKFPLVVITYQGQSSDAEFEAFLETFTRVCMREGAKAFLFDARLSQGAPPSQRQRMAQWMMNDMSKARSGFACIAFVFHSAVVRGVLTAIFWLTPLKLRHGIFSDIDEARTFCLEQIARREARLQQRVLARP